MNLVIFPTVEMMRTSWIKIIGELPGNMQYKHRVPYKFVQKNGYEWWFRTPNPPDHLYGLRPKKLFIYGPIEYYSEGAWEIFKVMEVSGAKVIRRVE